MRFFDISRDFRDRFDFSWMLICLVFIMILPFILFTGLLIKINADIGHIILWLIRCFPASGVQ